MSLKPVNDILRILKQEAKWEEPPLQKLVKFWGDIVGTVVAANTRPLSIQRDVLWVATSSAAWAQNLTFSRQTILMKLNQKLSTPLVDIRFSSAEWKQQPIKSNQPTISPQEHPSYLGDVILSESELKANIQDVNTTFADLARVIQKRSQNLPLCPQCQCPTPPGELRRWLVCSPCAVKQLGN